MKKTILLIAVLTLGTGSLFSVSSEEIDKNLKKLKLSGMLRFRTWHYGNDGFTTPSGVQVQRRTFQDLFFRNRLSLNISPSIEIRTLFDIGTLRFGDPTEGSAIDQDSSGQKNLRTRHVYLRLRPSKYSQLLLGLQPFVFTGGFVLAQNGAGIAYKHLLFRGKLLPYFTWIKATENSFNDIDGNGIAGTGFNDNDIYAIGTKIAIGSLYKAEIYYIHNSDQENNNFSNWMGLHNQLLIGKFNVDAATIVNWGKLSGLNEKNRGLLWSLSAGYSISGLILSLITEGASGDISSQNRVNSFQDIRPSHGLAFIFADNSGGLSLRSGGRLAGVAAIGFGTKYSLSGVTLSIKLLHLRSMVSLGTGTVSERNYIGDEFNFRAQYTVFDYVSLYSTFAAFQPQRAYSFIISDLSQNAILEVLLGAQVNY